MPVVKEFRTSSDFWSGMVEPDYHEFVKNQRDLRAAFHAAISLFHMHDWVWHTHEVAVRKAFLDTKTERREAKDRRQPIIRRRTRKHMPGFCPRPWHRKRGEASQTQKHQAGRQRTKPRGKYRRSNHGWWRRV